MDGFVSDHRTPIDFARERQLDFAGINSLFDFIVREQLPWRVAVSESNLDLFPNWVEAISRHRIDDGNKRLPPGKPASDWLCSPAPQQQIINIPLAEWLHRPAPHANLLARFPGARQRPPHARSENHQNTSVPAELLFGSCSVLGDQPLCKGDPTSAWVSLGLRPALWPL